MPHAAPVLLAPLLLAPLLLGACAPGAGGPAGSTPIPASAVGPAAAGPSAPAGEGLGTVHQSGPDVWYVAPDGDAGGRYCLEGPLVAETMKTDGHRVHFAGAPGEIPPNVRLACTPFTYTLLASAE